VSLERASLCKWNALSTSEPPRVHGEWITPYCPLPHSPALLRSSTMAQLPIGGWHWCVLPDANLPPRLSGQLGGANQERGGQHRQAGA
jgi:hypothetical protein